MPSRRLALYQVDAFTDTPFGGNPAAVVLLGADEKLSDEVRQSIAAEMNLSETSFVELLPASSANPSFSTSGRFKLRWNTPVKEVKLCGHATLAAAAAIALGENNTAEALHFDTVHSGQLIVSKADSASGFNFAMDLPADKPTASVPDWAKAGSLLIRAVLGSSESLLEEVCFSSSLKYLQLVLKDGTTREQLEAIQPTFADCLSAAKDGFMLAIVTTRGCQGKHDFLSRVFAPWAGIDEDPVTGSAFAVLGPWWAEKLGKGSSPLTARQCSARGGELKVIVDMPAGRVKLLGNAVIVSKGELYL